VLPTCDLRLGSSRQRRVQVSWEELQTKFCRQVQEVLVVLVVEESLVVVLPMD
jgi:hypothetical protein